MIPLRRQPGQPCPGCRPVGRRTALDAGHNAVVTARDADSVRDLTDAHPDTALPVALDVTDPGQVAEAVRLGEDRFGAVDVLVKENDTAHPARRPR